MWLWGMHLYLVRGVSLLPGHPVSRFPRPHPSTMMVSLTSSPEEWSQPLMDGDLSNHELPNKISPL